MEDNQVVNGYDLAICHHRVGSDNKEIWPDFPASDFTFILAFLKSAYGGQDWVCLGLFF